MTKLTILPKEVKLELIKAKDRGVMILNQKVDNWWNGGDDKVDIARLDMASANACMLGQKFISYHKGLRSLFPMTQAIEGNYDEYLDKEAFTHGFDVNTRLDSKIGAWYRMDEDDRNYYNLRDEKLRNAYSFLTELWRDEVVQRRLLLGERVSTEDILAAEIGDEDEAL